ncbi:MAG: hypothetical protein ACOCUI_00115 [bacterium]
MAQVSPVYEEENEMHEIVTKLREKYYDLFYAVDPSDIKGYLITNKPRPDTKPAEVTIKGASGVFAYVNPFRYVLVAYADDWCNWSITRKAINIAKAIKRISPDGHGKLEKFDEVNHRSFLLTFGIGYEEDPDLVNILEEDVDWKI